MNCISVFSILFQWLTLFFLPLYRSLTGFCFWMIFCIKTMTTYKWNCYCLIKQWVVSLRKLHAGGRWRINRRTNDLYSKLTLSYPFQTALFENDLWWQKTYSFSSFCGVTDIPVLDFWWCLPWISKPWWIPLLVYFVTFLMNCSDSPLVPTPADLLPASMPADPFAHLLFQAFL